MTTPTTPHEQAARHDPVYDRLHAAPEFTELRRLYRGFVFPATAAFLEAVREVGYPVTPANLPEGQGFSQTMVSQTRGGRASTADAYLRPARRRRNLRVVTGAHVRRVTFAAGRATGVYVEIAGVRRHAVARREVILSGGAINTPQLLMLSGIGPAAHLAELSDGQPPEMLAGEVMVAVGRRAARAAECLARALARRSTTELSPKVLAAAPTVPRAARRGWQRPG